MRKNCIIILKMLFLINIYFPAGAVFAQEPVQQSQDQKGSQSISPASSGTQVIQAFTSKEDDIESELIKIDDQRKRQVMFAMGVPLLLFIIVTVGLGIAMGVFGKDVYIAHMIFAGLSLTLAMGHAIVGLVWFWPF